MTIDVASPPPPVRPPARTRAEELHRKLAALLAADGQSREAWASYRKALEHLLGRGFADQAVGVCREAVRSLPREASTWRALAALEVERQRPADAICALLEGRSQFRSRSQRAQVSPRS